MFGQLQTYRFFEIWTWDETEVHFFAVSLMKADVFPGDYMYSNDLIVLFLLTYFTIGGSRGLISDNVFFFYPVWFQVAQIWISFDNSSWIEGIFRKHNVNTFRERIRPKKKNWCYVSQKWQITCPYFTKVFSKYIDGFIRDIFSYYQLVVECSLAEFPF